MSDMVRGSDPDTSAEAASTVDVTRDRMIALAIYEALYPRYVTDGHIAKFVEEHMPDRIPESIRRRCSDLRTGKGFDGVPQIEGDPLLDENGDPVIHWNRPQMKRMQNPNGSWAYGYRWIKRG